MPSTMRHNLHRRRQHIETRYLIDRCTIERSTTAMDADNWYENEPVWSTHLTNVPCLLTWGDAEGETITAERTVIRRIGRLLFPVGTDVEPHDRVTSVTRYGTEHLREPLDLKAPITGDFYLEFAVSETS